MRGFDPVDKIVLLHGMLVRKADELARSLEHARRSVTETVYPNMDVLQQKNCIILIAELPGLQLEDFSLYQYEDLIVLEGNKPVEKLSGKVNFLRMERDFSPFRRILKLPVPVETGQIEATLKDGVLRVVLPCRVEP